jgi:ABC-type glycerol-3-phosphate transport system permease component
MIPKSLYGAAELDGSNSVQTLLHIAIPTVKSAIFSLAIILVISAWNSYLWPSLVSTDLSNSLIQVGLKSFVNADSFNYGALMAASTIACLPVLIVYVIFLQQIQNVNVQSGIK